jgi:hypothetical protein
MSIMAAARPANGVPRLAPWGARSAGPMYPDFVLYELDPANPRNTISAWLIRIRS